MGMKEEAKHQGEKNAKGKEIKKEKERSTLNIKEEGKTNGGNKVQVGGLDGLPPIFPPCLAHNDSLLIMKEYCKQQEAKQHHDRKEREKYRSTKERKNEKEGEEDEEERANARLSLLEIEEKHNIRSILLEEEDAVLEEEEREDR